MNLFNQLDEAANIPLDQLKDRMKKDPRVKFIFTRGPTLDQVKDPAEFIKTMRFYVFSNPQVRAHMEKRADRRDISRGWWQRMGAIKPTDKLDKDEFGRYVELIKDLFKDAGYVQKKDLSKRAYEAFMGIFGHRARPQQMDAYSIREIDSLDFRTDKPLTLYRGLIFDERSMRSDDFSGSAGLKFLQSIRKGKRVADLDYTDTVSIWTTDRNEALSLALYDGDSSWKKYKEGDPKKIEKYKGVLAFVVSKLAAPEDILVDMREYSKAVGWPPSSDSSYNNVVLKPGKHMARIVGKFTQEGEQDVLGKINDDIDIEDVKDRLGFLGKILKLPVEEIHFEGFDRFTHDPEVMKQLAVLNDPEVKEKLAKLMNSVVQVYKKHIQPIDITQLLDQAGEHSATLDALKQIHDLFGNYIYHPAYANPESSRRSEREHGTVYFKDLRAGEDALTARPWDARLDDAVNVIATQKRWTQWNTSSVWVGLAKIGDPNIVIPEKLHLSGWAQQKKVVDAALKGFYQVMGKQMPKDVPTVWAKDFKQAASEAIVVSKAARFLQDLKRLATEAGA